MQSPQQPIQACASLAHTELSESATLYRVLADQRLGQQLQASLLPAAELSWQAYHFHSLVRPALYLSGDTLDYLALDQDRHFFYLADVAGHGTASALGSVLLQGLMRQAIANGQNHLTPASILQAINQQWLTIGIEKHATLILGCIDQRSQQLSWSMAGHLPAPVFMQQGQARFLSGKGQPIGLFANAQYSDNSLDLSQPFSLHLFSDGVFELLNAQRLQAKEQQLLELVEQTSGQWSELLSQLRLDRSEVIDDDVALLTISRML